ncbi:uncharacterized protein LOC121180136 isoform X1 [Toxotes jaculatrix]|uniref:uncharacterized protein LOC121180136 isoform X1 n=1 Tax=Toxotes jaculatrix TaxID=941984 RepID=UPI001B3B0A29|nr:uncharacterized protein LOC121180136 isoform X1 [Toxotes jaculatrix]
MIKIYIYSCLLSALTIVEVKTLSRNGHVGKSVTFICSDWNVWTNTENNVKYLCQSPCSKDKDIIIKAAFGKTERKDRIYLTNTRQGLNVTFTNLQMSDSKKYICGLERFGSDSYIDMHLQVIDDPTTTAKSTTVGSTVPLSVLSNFIMSSSTSDIITDMFTSYTTLHTTTATGSTTAGAGSVPYLIIGSTVIITILMVLMKLMRKMMKKQQTSSSDGQQEDTQGEAGYDEVRIEDHQPESPPLAAYALHVFTDTDPDNLYANCYYHQDTELAAESAKHSKNVSLNSASKSEVNPRRACADNGVTDPRSDLVYSVAQLPKQQTEPTGKYEPNQSESNDGESLYFLAQPPQVS